MKRVVLEVLVLSGFAAALAFAANSVRGSGSLKWTRNYFDAGPARPRGSDADITVGVVQDMAGATGAAASDTEEAHVEHSYQSVSFEEVVAILGDPNTAAGVNVFIDARSDDAFEAGHIPGAIQCDHYRLEDYLDDLLAAVEIADKVVVYCNGGDCEDSIFVCADLVEAGVAYERIYLYGGGWKQWEAKQMPVATGRLD